jgi:hypothetical protein
MKNLFFISFLLFLSVNAFASKKIEGTLIDSSGQVLKVTFKVPITALDQGVNFLKLQEKVVYYNEKGKKVTAWPNEIKEIKFEYQGKTVRMISCSNTIRLGGPFSKSYNLLMELVVDGPLQLFRHYDMVSNDRRFYFPEILFILRNPDGKLAETNKRTFVEEMAIQLRNCPTLVKKIQDKVYAYQDLPAVIAAYNTCK